MPDLTAWCICGLFLLSYVCVLTLKLTSWCICHLTLLRPPCIADADIIFLPCGFFLSFFIPRIISTAADWMSSLPYFHTWCGPSVNLECRSEICCMQLAGNTGRKNDAKNCHLRTIAQLCRALSSQLRHVSTIGKNLLSSNISPTCTHNMVNLGLLAAEIVSLVWGTQLISTGFTSWQHYGTATLRRWTESATCIQQGSHHVGHWPTFLVSWCICHLFVRVDVKCYCFPCCHVCALLLFCVLLTLAVLSQLLAYKHCASKQQFEAYCVSARLTAWFQS